MSVKDNMENWIYPIKERFKLSENFIKEYEGVEPEWGPLGKLTYKRTYAARIEGEDRTEEWWETVKRVVEACYTIQLNHCKNLRLPWNGHKAQKSAQEMYTRMFEFKFIPPGRGLANMGDLVFKKSSIFLFNCSAITTKNIDKCFSDPFVFMCDVSMAGVGVGYDCEGAGKVTFHTPKTTDEPFIVDDSREGWCEIIKVVLESFVGKASLPNTIDYSQVRPFGSPIVTSGGYAPGPQPLIDCVNDIKEFLYKKVDKKITSGNIVDIMNLIGKCVVAGGRRRSAQIAFGYPDDEEYMSLKDPDLYSEEMMHHRWCSNNSVYGYQGMDYTNIVENIKKSGEPGIAYLDKIQNYGRMKDGYQEGIDSEATIMNPCGEISLSGGNGAGGELCNIADVFPANHESLDDFKKSIKFAYLYCKTVTLIPCHNEFTNSIILKNRRIGVSQSGIIQAIQKLGTSTYFKWCDDGYNYIKHLDKKYSDWLCIQRSIKLSTVKPSGSTSLLMGATPGLHYPMSEYYIRRIRIEMTQSQLIEAVKKAGYKHEISAYGDNSIVFEIPVKEKNFYKGKSDASVWEQMQLGSKLQYYWSDNSISQTVHFSEEEKSNLNSVMEFYEDQIKTVSFLPLDCSAYVQMPYETITKEEYEDRIKNVKPIDFTFKGNTKDTEEKYCNGDTCVL